MKTSKTDRATTLDDVARIFAELLADDDNWIREYERVTGESPWMNASHLDDRQVS